MRAPDRLLRDLRERPSTSDRATDLYIAVLAVLVFVVPLARWATLQLAPAMAWNVSPMHVALVTGALGVAAVGAGRTRGPVAPSAPYIDWVVSGPDELARVLRPFWRRSLAGVTALAVVAGLVVVASRDTWPDPVAAVVLAVVVIAFGLLLAVAWLAGQSRLALPAVVLVLLAAVAGWPIHDAWTALATAPRWWVMVVPVIAVVAMLSVRRVVVVLPPSRLRTQALRWSQVENFAITADLASAADVLRGRTRRGRRWRPAFGAPILVRRDVVGLLRSPGRAAAGVGLAFLSGLLLGPAHTAPTPIIAIVAVALSYAAACYLSDGLRFTAANRSRPPVFGFTPARTALQHLVVPTVLLVVVMSGAAAAGGASAAGCGLALLALACRAASAFKGLLPIEYLTPIMTPVGEMSSLRVLFWVADAFLVCMLVGATILFQADLWTGTGLLLLAAVLVGFWARSRWAR
ncbi:hypothetical protein D9V41_00680 [Aeromicrobium phragmitis]|uniref:Uncharacterized protein n=1 Tax=Aeromicrobium phragmitis TaxID=2478914 RepID=A0A3L8PRD8_9ACTN|nr:hypothetical protein [Aeromicrobium phragmitis]RLV57203.1 hypothetical protein D9V41_00680 [Aeromicrobium phragmitis]